MTGPDKATYTRERPGMSAFVSRTAPCTTPIRLRARTRRPLGHVPMARPRAPGRNEKGVWFRRHDEYDKG